MNSSFRPLNFEDSLHHDHAYRTERTGRVSGETPLIAIAGFARGLEQLVRRTVVRIVQWRRRRATIRELQTWSDHYLKDIGLERSQIASAVDGIPESGGHPAAFIARLGQKRW